MSNAFKQEARELALEMALEFRENQEVNSALVVADAIIFYRYLTMIPEGFAPATG